MSGTTFGFQGQRYDAETGLYYMKARYYDSKTGRFLQPDPIGYGDGPNVYQFAYNNPINFSDPLGLAADGSPLVSDVSKSASGGTTGTLVAQKGSTAALPPGKLPLSPRLIGGLLTFALLEWEVLSYIKKIPISLDIKAYGTILFR